MDNPKYIISLNLYVNGNNWVDAYGIVFNELSKRLKTSTLIDSWETSDDGWYELNDDDIYVPIYQIAVERIREEYNKSLKIT